MYQAGSNVFALSSNRLIETAYAIGIILEPVNKRGQLADSKKL
jgi:hypothetical protein